MTGAAGGLRSRLVLAAAGLLAALGLAGLTVGVIGAQDPITHASGASSAGLAVTQNGVTVSGLYIRATAAGSAPVHFTVHNNSDRPVQFEKAYSGASWRTRLHSHPDSPEPHDAGPSTPIPIPAGAVTQLGPQQPHLMLDEVIAPLTAGDQVNVILYFAGAGQFLVTAPVIPADAPAPVDAPS